MTQGLFEIWKDADLENFGEFLEQAPVMMHSTSKDGRLAAVSREWANHLGYEPEEMVGKRLPDLLTPESRHQALTQEIPRFLRTGRAENLEYDFVCKDGTVVPILVSSIARYEEDGSYSNSVAVMSDNSANKFLEMFERKAQKAERENSAKTRFLANMSHELRTPLNAIIGFAQMLNGLGGPIGEQKKEEYAGYIMESGDRLLKLINQVLDLSSIESGNEEMSLEEVEVAPVVQQVTNEIRILAEPKKITVIDDVSAADLPKIKADPKRLTQALVNLVANAVKYNRENGEVRVYARKQVQTMRLIVSDTGPGIPVERHFEVFETFNRLGAEQTGLEGNGVGLSLTKEYVEKMGGSVGFESARGEGSVFWLELPLAGAGSNPIAEIDWLAGRKLGGPGTVKAPRQRRIAVS